MRDPIFAGIAYFGCVFAAGFALGVIRTVVIAPLTSETLAVAMELPVLLAIAWIACRWLTSQFRVPFGLVSRAVMGAVAFVLLMAGELSISVLLAGRSIAEHLQLYDEAPHALGLAGQIAFALFPILQIWSVGDGVSRRALSGKRRGMVGVLAAVALYVLWTFATWFLEGRIETLLRPDSAGDRAIYAIVANLLIGLIVGMVVLRHLIRRKILAKLDAGFGPATPSPVRLAIAMGLGFTLYVLQGAPSLHPIVLTNVFSQVLVVSAAEVILCWAVLGAAVEAGLRSSGRIVSLIGAALVASVLFGVYHFAHSAPFNTSGMVVLLTIVGLVTSAFFFLVRDVYATILFHNFLGVFGVVQALEASGRLSALETLQPPLLAMAVVTIGALAICDRTMLRPSEAPGHADN